MLGLSMTLASSPLPKSSMSVNSSPPTSLLIIKALAHSSSLKMGVYCVHLMWIYGYQLHSNCVPFVLKSPFSKCLVQHNQRWVRGIQFTTLLSHHSPSRHHMYWSMSLKVHRSPMLSSVRMSMDSHQVLIILEARESFVCFLGVFEWLVASSTPHSLTILTGQGPGVGLEVHGFASGGGHATYGSSANVVIGGIPYDDYVYPTMPGSGGGSATVIIPGQGMHGFGGGVIFFITPWLGVQGNVIFSSNGASGYCQLVHCVGAGAGGTIFLQVDNGQSHVNSQLILTANSGSSSPLTKYGNYGANGGNGIISFTNNPFAGALNLTVVSILDPTSNINIVCSPGTFNSVNYFRGYYSGQSLALCEACSTGTYQPYAGQFSCLACPSAFFNPTLGASNISACQACPAGMSSDSGAGACQDCDAGTYSVSGGLCVECPRGTTSTPGSTNCTSCGVGAYVDNWGFCQQCQPGRYSSSPIASSFCSWCSPGYYAPFSGMSSCLLCPVGSYSQYTESYFCYDCEAGSYAPNPGMTACLFCELGKYQPNISSSYCAACEAGLCTNDYGTDCVNCSQSIGLWKLSSSFFCGVCVCVCVCLCVFYSSTLCMSLAPTSASGEVTIMGGMVGGIGICVCFSLWCYFRTRYDKPPPPPAFQPLPPRIPASTPSHPPSHAVPLNSVNVHTPGRPAGKYYSIPSRYTQTEPERPYPQSQPQPKLKK